MANEVRVTIIKGSPCHRTLVAIAEEAGYRNLTDVVAMMAFLFGKHLLAWAETGVPMGNTGNTGNSGISSTFAPVSEEPEEPEEFGGFE